MTDFGLLLIVFKIAIHCRDGGTESFFNGRLGDEDALRERDATRAD